MRGIGREHDRAQSGVGAAASGGGGDAGLADATLAGVENRAWWAHPNPLRVVPRPRWRAEAAHLPRLGFRYSGRAIQETIRKPGSYALTHIRTFFADLRARSAGRSVRRRLRRRRFVPIRARTRRPSSTRPSTTRSGSPAADCSFTASGSVGGEQGGSFDASLSGPLQGDADDPNAIPQLAWDATVSAEGSGQSFDFAGGLTLDRGQRLHRVRRPGLRARQRDLHAAQGRRGAGRRGAGHERGRAAR